MTFVVFSLYFLSGFALRQVGGHKKIGDVSMKSFPVWVMFAFSALKVTQVRFEERMPDGRWRPIDRYKVLGLDRLDKPRGVWKVKGLKDAKMLGRRLCRALGPGTDLRLHARTATTSGWKTQSKGRRNLCRTR